jgi:hypothetical protein
MSLARIKSWIAQEVLTASDLNAEFNNLLQNTNSLISPLTANLAAGGFKVTGLAAATVAGDAVRYEDQTAAATQANQETATSTTTFVSPGRQQFHPSACKAWANGDFAGAIKGGAGVGSYNIASVTDAGAGTQTFNLTVPFSSVNYAVIANGDGAALRVWMATISGAGSIGVVAYVPTTSAATDGTNTCIAAFGDQ